MNTYHRPPDSLVVGTFFKAESLSDAFKAALTIKRKLGCSPMICSGSTKDGELSLAVYAVNLIVVDDPVN